MNEPVRPTADWSLTVDPIGSPPIFAMECTTCGDEAEVSYDEDDPKSWCLKHAGRTGHVGFRSMTTGFYRAFPVEPGPSSRQHSSSPP